MSSLFLVILFLNGIGGYNDFGLDDNVEDSNCFLNLTTNPFEDEFGAIRLNISWLPQITTKTTPTIHIFIKLVSNDINCLSHQTIAQNYHLNKSYIVVPDLEIIYPAEQFQPGCQYLIKIKNYYNDQCELYYRVPECVGNVCDCYKYKPDVKLRNIEFFSKNIYKLNWDEASPYDNITHLDVILNEIDEIHYLDGKVEKLKQNEAFLDLKDIPEGEYILNATFFNNYSCPSFDSIHFNITAPNSNIILTVLIIPPFLLLFFTIIICKRRLIKLGQKLFGSSNYNDVEYEIHEIAGHTVKMSNNPQYISTDKCELSRKDIEFIKFLDKGAFGQVYEGRYKKTIKIAIKTLDKGAGTDEIIAFKDEIELYKKIGEHPNIVKLYGCCMLEDPLLIIMEYVSGGSLKNYLENISSNWKMSKDERKFFVNSIISSDGAYITPNMDSPTSMEFPSTPKTAETSCEYPLLYSTNKILDTDELQNFSQQIAKGMAYLEKIKITHRDLAARNILINENKQLKISDFGLARSGVYVKQTPEGKQPLRWMAIESILDRKFDNKSDVWSFGIVLWEIGTLCVHPYPYPNIPINNQLTLLIDYLLHGGRLSRPHICTDELYEIMQKCWAHNPDDRYSFKELVDILDKKKVYVWVEFDTDGTPNPEYFQLDDVPKTKSLND